MKTMIYNGIVLVAGLLAAFGIKLDLTTDDMQMLAGGVVVLLAVVNQVIVYVINKKGTPS